MKAGIHPNYNMIQVTCACGNTFETGSVKKEIRVETCSECHPFYTGRQKFAEAGGRVDRFNKKYGLKDLNAAENNFSNRQAKLTCLFFNGSFLKLYCCNEN